MPSVKELIRRIKNMTQKEALIEIGRAMSEPGADREGLDFLLDSVLKTESTAEDVELVGAWESENRGR